jgi:CRP/FNR family transcriptional regulator, cyclic AMP receptor protein
VPSWAQTGKETFADLTGSELSHEDPRGERYCQVVSHADGIHVSGAAPLHATLLEQLGEVERDALLARLRPRQYKRGQVVFNEGDSGDCLYLVQFGRFEVQSTTPAGQAITFRVVQPGEFFGELALVHPENQRAARVCALEAGEVLVLTRHDFDELRRSHPGVDRFLVTALADRLKRTSELVVELLLPPERRLWRRLAVLAEAYGSDPIRMSQDDLAHAAGTIRQTANRVLQQGVRDGVLVVERGSVRILDLSALDRLARG